ncbi:MAG: ACT domain-containing protein [Clostridiales bacterium]|nr:ACT domain-containing protein [Clostridiales bacterium]
MLKQISVFLENKKGVLARATKLLGREGIDLIALSIADTTDFGIMRCLVSRPDDALKVLSENGFLASTTEVLAVAVPDTPGGLAGLLDLIEAGDINVDYLYSFVRNPNENALILLKPDDVDACRKLFAEKGIVTLSDEEVYEGAGK